MTTSPRFRSERLRADHGLDSFTCGNPDLDAWLRDSARQANAAGTARTYVWVDRTGEVVAYYALAPNVVRKADVPKRIGHGAPETIPAILLARLALAGHLQGRGYGSELLSDALSVALEAVRLAGGRLIVVDAIDDGAAAFYAHIGFEAASGPERRMIMKASQAARWLGIAWP